MTINIRFGKKDVNIRFGQGYKLKDRVCDYINSLKGVYIELPFGKR